jgi:hypothetical protein
MRLAAPLRKEAGAAQVDSTAAGLKQDMSAIPLFVVLQADLRLTDRFVGCLQGFCSVPAEILRCAAHLFPRTAKRSDRPAHLRMGFRRGATAAPGREFFRRPGRGNGCGEAQGQNEYQYRKHARDPMSHRLRPGPKMRLGRPCDFTLGAITLEPETTALGYRLRGGTPVSANDIRVAGFQANVVPCLSSKNRAVPHIRERPRP